MLVLVYLVRMHPGASAMHGVLSRRPRDFDQAAISRSRFLVKVDDDVGGHASLIIATVYLVGNCAAMPFTGASLNPTRHLGPAIFTTISCDAFDHLWLYWAGPMSASFVGTLLHDVRTVSAAFLDDDMLSVSVLRTIDLRTNWFRSGFARALSGRLKSRRLSPLKPTVEYYLTTVSRNV
eukprot:COSAG05_NODE_5267_length_1219_cov_1.863393_2_plen_179_part_00